MDGGRRMWKRTGGVTGKASFGRMFLVYVDILKFKMEHLGNI